MTISVATWNVNSVKSRLSILLQYLASDEAPDVLLLQELKCQEDSFPYMEIEDKGYNIAVNGQKTYNGVAILSKYPIDDIVKALPGDDTDEQSRYIEAVISVNSSAIRVASIYVPNGQSIDSDKFQYKMNFFDRLYSHTKELLSYEEILILGGDYNVAPEQIDVYDPKNMEGSICFHPKERAKYRELMSLGLYNALKTTDPNKQQFSWWDYRGGSWQHNKGMLIDHLLLSPEATNVLKSCNIHTKYRALEKPSDHTQVECILDI